MKQQTAPRAPLLVVTGPTASGKTALALELARRLNGELVGADSVQVYRGFDLGSAKPNAAELGPTPHHLLDVAEANTPLDAADFARLADQAIAEVRGRQRLPLVVGGSGLWLRALLRGLVQVPPVDAALRQALETEAEQRGSPALHAELGQVDPHSAAQIHPNDRLRIVRALEVYRQTGTALGELRRAHALGQPRYHALRIVLDPDPELLSRRIEARVDAMLAAGFVDEVQTLLDRYGPQVRPLASVGYAQICEHLRGELSLEEARLRMIQATRLYARRQRTWLRNEPGLRFCVTTPDEVLCEAGMARLGSHLNDHDGTGAAG